MFIISILGFLLFAAGVASIFSPYVSKQVPLNKYLAILIGLFLMVIRGGFFYADAGTAYAVQYMTGGDKMIKTQGLKAKWWGRTIPIKYESSIKFNILRGKQELPESSAGIYNLRAKKYEFQDAIKADIAVSVVAGVSIEDETKFLKMADRNGSEAKLIHGRVIPNIEAALKNTCKIMGAQDYISGRSADFDRYFQDQLENGMYELEKYVENSSSEVIGDTTTVRKINTNNNRQAKFRIKRDKNGDPIRNMESNTLKQYGIKIHQALITEIDWEGSFDKRLQLQKEQVAQTQLEKQQAEREFYRAKKEKAAGEAEKAKERARLEKEQIQQTIAAETRSKVANQDLIAEKKRYEVEQFRAKSKKVAADAQAYENQRLVTAGLTPEQRIKADIQKNRDKWENIGKMQLNGVYMMGNQNAKGDGILSSLIGADLAKKMQK